MPFKLDDHELPDYVKEIPPYEMKIRRVFTSDGCSGGMSVWWRRLFGKAPPWEGCCVEHDLAYWYGGTFKDRKRADKELRKCVTKKGHPIWAWIMYLSVRIGGGPLLPFPWRWGYGWPWGARYSKEETRFDVED